jgi:hypothetical protein
VAVGKSLLLAMAAVQELQHHTHHGLSLNRVIFEASSHGPLAHLNAYVTLSTLFFTVTVTVTWFKNCHFCNTPTQLEKLRRLVWLPPGVRCSLPRLTPSCCLSCPSLRLRQSCGAACQGLWATMTHEQSRLWRLTPSAWRWAAAWQVVSEHVCSGVKPLMGFAWLNRQHDDAVCVTNSSDTLSLLPTDTAGPCSSGHHQPRAPGTGR